MFLYIYNPKKLFWIYFIMMIVFMPSIVFGQGYKPPESGKAVVYFVRITSYGQEAVFDFFHNDKYIGSYSGMNYIRYECDPGGQLFWASSENKVFLPATLNEGRSYVVIVDVIYGFAKAHVGLQPISESQEDKINRATNIINLNRPVYVDEKQIEVKNKKLQTFISKQLIYYNKETQEGTKFNRLDPDMAISTK
jgi:hypothetical protein